MLSWMLIYEKHPNLLTISFISAIINNNKQAVQRALAIFHKTTIAGLKSLLPDRSDFSGFLSLINTWWLIVNSKHFSTTTRNLRMLRLGRTMLKVWKRDNNRNGWGLPSKEGINTFHLNFHSSLFNIGGCLFLILQLYFIFLRNI